MNAKMAMVWVLAAGMCMAGVRGQDVETASPSGTARGLDIWDEFPLLSGLDWNSNGSATLHFYAVEGAQYTIHGANALGDCWTYLDSWVSATNGEVAVEFDPMGMWFFRIITTDMDGGGDEVLSANALGGVKRSIPAKGRQMVSVPFDNPESEDGSFRFGETQMAKELPVGSIVYFWDGERQTWDGGMKSAFGWDSAEANHVLQIGEGICVFNPSDEDMEVAVSGEVPSSETTSRSFVGGGNLSVMAYPYPKDIKFGDSALANELPFGSTVYFWDSGAQNWASSRKSAKGWAAYAAYQVLAGSGFFVRSETEGTWEAPKPYTWP